MISLQKILSPEGARPQHFHVNLSRLYLDLYLETQQTLLFPLRTSEKLLPLPSARPLKDGAHPESICGGGSLTHLLPLAMTLPCLKALADVPDF